MKTKGLMQSNNSLEYDEEEVIAPPKIRPHISSSFSFRPSSFPSRPSLDESASRFSSNIFLEDSKGLNFPKPPKIEEELFSDFRISDIQGPPHPDRRHPKSKRSSKLRLETDIQVDYSASAVAFNRQSEIPTNLESLLQAEEELKSIFSKKSRQKKVIQVGSACFTHHIQ